MQDAANPHGSIECDVLVVPQRSTSRRIFGVRVILAAARKLGAIGFGPRQAFAFGQTEFSAFLAEHPNRSIEVHQNIMVSKNAFAEPFTGGLA